MGRERDLDSKEIKRRTKELAAEIRRELRLLGLEGEDVERRLLGVLRNGASPERKEKARRILRLAWEVVEINLPLLVRKAVELEHFGKSSVADRDDALQELCLIALRAALKYDPGKREFSTYFNYWAKTLLMRALLKSGFSLRIPQYVYEKLVARLLGKEVGGLSEGEARALEAMAGSEARLDDLVYGDGSRLRFRDVLPDDAPDPEETAAELEAREFLREVLEGLLSELEPKEQVVLRMRYGLDGEEPRSLREVGRVLGGLSKQRIQQIEAKAVRRLRGKVAGWPREMREEVLKALQG